MCVGGFLAGRGVGAVDQQTALTFDSLTVLKQVSGLSMGGSFASVTRRYRKCSMAAQYVSMGLMVMLMFW